MLKKVLAAFAVAGVMVLGVGSAASADDYPAQISISVSASTVNVGQPVTITVTGAQEFSEVAFSLTADGASLSSIVAAATAGSSVSKPVVDGTAAATFVASQTGTFVVNVAADGQSVGSATITVVASGAGGSGGSGTGLPATGGNVPGAALWLGIGAVGIGGIAFAAVAARRRAAGNR